LVQVQYVEVAIGEPALDLAVGGRAEPQARDRPVVRDRHGLASGYHVVGQLDVWRRRCEHADLMATVAHDLRQLQHVGWHAAGYVERIRADHADAHQVSPLSLACRSSDRSASHCGCSMCQSSGCAAMPLANLSAISWVMVVISPDDVSSGS